MTTTATPGPDALLQMSFAMAQSHVLSAALQLAIFTHLHEGKKTVAEIARAADSSERGVRMLLDTLVGFQLLAKAGGRYENGPLAEHYLVRTKPDYVGPFFEGAAKLAQDWSQLASVVRSGKPLVKVETKEVAEQFFPILIQGLHVTHREHARRAAEVVTQGKTGNRVLDLACGSGVWSIAIAERDREARLVLQDFPGVLESTRTYLARHGVLDRSELLPGDLKTVDLGRDRFDVAVLGHIVHSEGEASSRDLFRRVFSALRPGGRIAIADMVPNDERTGPPFPLLFALNMLLHTETGSTYTLAEYRAWLTEAGFTRVETADVGAHSPLVIAHRG